jgi:hypothetical protein
VDRVVSGQHAEDSVVELKTSWPDPGDAARQVAAHANAAGGADILWLIGVDEKTGVVGAPDTEVADWVAGLAACFDDAHPRLQRDQNVTIDGNTVVALLFATDRAPYLVRNPTFGKQNGGPVRWEVPWREGRSTRSARRHELLKVLANVAPRPEIECLDCTIRLAKEWIDTVEHVAMWYVEGRFYIVPQPERRHVYPTHRARAHLLIGEDIAISQWRNLILSTLRVGSGVNPTGSEVEVTGPGLLTLSASQRLEMSEESLRDDARLDLVLHDVWSDVPVTWSGSLVRGDPGPDAVATWRLAGAA